VPLKNAPRFGWLWYQPTTSRPPSSGPLTRCHSSVSTTLQAEQYPAVGLDHDLRLAGPKLGGGALVVDGHLVHLAVFAQEMGA
jgi:hypothetical protein